MHHKPSLLSPLSLIWNENMCAYTKKKPASYGMLSKFATCLSVYGVEHILLDLNLQAIVDDSKSNSAQFIKQQAFHKQISSHFHNLIGTRPGVKSTESKIEMNAIIDLI